MNAELFIARRINGSVENRKKISTAIVRITIVGIALGLAVMLISTAIVTGFKNQIKNKVVGFGSHIQITNFDSNNSYETRPINKNQVSVSALNHIKGVRHCQAYITKSGILKTKDNFQAVILKGIDQNFDPYFFKKNIKQGRFIEINDSVKSNEIIISEHIAALLKLKIGDKITVYFLQDPPRMRSFTISGIYKTGIEDFDKAFVLMDLRHLQKLNAWTSNQISGYEVLINDYNQLNSITDSVFATVGYQFSSNGEKLKVTNIKQRYPQIFDWLNVQDINVWIILILMVLVAGFNMVSSLLILILERTNTIGILKAVGYNNWHIRKIFVYQSAFLTIKGLVWGNVIGIGLCLVQQYFGIIPLDEAVYHLSTVPINLKLLHVLYLNIGTLITIFVMMILPSALITKINPAKAIRFN